MESDQCLVVIILHGTSASLISSHLVAALWPAANTSTVAVRKGITASLMVNDAGSL